MGGGPILASTGTKPVTTDYVTLVRRGSQVPLFLHQAPQDRHKPDFSIRHASAHHLYGLADGRIEPPGKEFGRVLPFVSLRVPYLAPVSDGELRVRP